MAQKTTYPYTLYFSDEWRLALVKTVVAYESVKRGLKIGPTILELVEQAVDLDSYPEQVKSYLEGIEESSRSRAAERVCGSEDLLRSA